MKDRLLKSAAAVSTTMLLTGCPAPKPNEPVPTQSGTVSVSPTQERGLQLPPPNLLGSDIQRRGSSLIPCFAGNSLPLPERERPIRTGLELNVTEGGLVTGTQKPPREIIDALARATVDVHFDLGNGSRIEGTGIILEDGRVLTAGHIMPQDDLKKITVIDNDGNTHRATAGCFGYYDQGRTARRTMAERTTVVDDLVVLQVDGQLPSGLRLGEEPQIGETIYIAGHPTPQRRSAKEVVPGIVVTGRDDTFQSSAMVGTGVNRTDPGDSGGAVVTSDLRLVGVFSSTGDLDQIVFNTNFAASTSEDTVTIASWTPVTVFRAAIEAQRAQAN